MCATLFCRKLGTPRRRGFSIPASSGKAKSVSVNPDKSMLKDQDRMHVFDVPSPEAKCRHTDSKQGHERTAGERVSNFSDEHGRPYSLGKHCTGAGAAGVQGTDLQSCRTSR